MNAEFTSEQQNSQQSIRNNDDIIIEMDDRQQENGENLEDTVGDGLSSNAHHNDLGYVHGDNDSNIEDPIDSHRSVPRPKLQKQHSSAISQKLDQIMSLHKNINVTKSLNKN